MIKFKQWHAEPDMSGFHVELTMSEFQTRLAQLDESAIVGLDKALSDATTDYDHMTVDFLEPEQWDTVFGKAEVFLRSATGKELRRWRYMDTATGWRWVEMPTYNNGVASAYSDDWERAKFHFCKSKYYSVDFRTV